MIPEFLRGSAVWRAQCARALPRTDSAGTRARDDTAAPQ